MNDEVGSLVSTLPGVPEWRLLVPIPAAPATPVSALPAVRVPDGAAVRLLLVNTPLDSATRRRLQGEVTALTDGVADGRPTVHAGSGAPVELTYGVDGDGRSYLVLPWPGPAAEENAPLPLPEVLAAARELGEALDALDVAGPPPTLHRTAAGGFVLGVPLPATLVELGGATAVEPPEVLRGGDWTPAGQVYACAALLWTMLTGRSPVGVDPLARLLGVTLPAMPRPDVPDAVTTVLHAGLATDPTDRPATAAALAQQLTAAFARSAAQETLAPERPGPAAQLDGDPLGSRYLLDQRIGRGATGHVRAGRRRDDGSPVAVKLLRSELAEDPEVVTRFLRERNTLTRLRHPNLVQVHDLVVEGDVLAIVMDLVPGEDLRRYLRYGPLPLPDAAALLAQSAVALAAVHAARIVHRDVKPENIMVTERNGRPVALLTDFGIARALEGPALTRLTQLIGTPAYLAPEVVAGRPVTPAADVYALGVTGYELLTGRRPFQAEMAVALMRAHVEDSVPRPDGLDDETWALLAQCLEKQPERRPDALQTAIRWATLAAPGALAGVPLPAFVAEPSGAGVSRRHSAHGTSSGSSDPNAVGPDVPGADTFGPDVPGADTFGPDAAGSHAFEPDAEFAEPTDPALATSMSARPLLRQPEPAPVRTKRRLWPILVAALVLVVVGAAVGVYLGRPSDRAGTSTAPSSAPEPTAYPLPAVVSLDGKGTATVSWNGSAAQLPGFEGFFVVRVTADRRTQVVSGPLAATVTESPVTGLQAGQRACFQVLAYVTAPAPSPAPPPVCVTPPSPTR